MKQKDNDFPKAVLKEFSNRITEREKFYSSPEGLEFMRFCKSLCMPLNETWSKEYEAKISAWLAFPRALRPTIVNRLAAAKKSSIVFDKR